jgi:mRNA interferase RelE/StbE
MIVRHDALAHRRAQERYLRAFDKGAHLVLGARPGHAFADEDEGRSFIGYCGKDSVRDCPGTRGSGRSARPEGQHRAAVREALEIHLRHEPAKTSRSRIKRLRGLQPQYRLRVGDARVFYDISGSTVEILAIVTKSEAEVWLGQFGDPE